MDVRPRGGQPAPRRASRRLAFITALLAYAVVPGLLAPPAPAGPGAPAPRLALTPQPSAPSQSTPPETAPEVQPEDQQSPTAEVRVLVSGDVLIHNSVWEAARTSGGFDFAPLLAGIRRHVRSADIAWCHLEIPLAAPEGPFLSYPRFSAPPQLAEGLRATGYDGCSTASNHSVDQGTPGVIRTLDTLDEAGIAHVGTARSRKEARRPLLVRVNDITVAWLSYTYGTNGLPVDAERPWSVNLIDPERIVADARRARRAGADAVLVALHWGTEYVTEPTPDQRRLAEQLTRSRAITLVYGHHAHVVQPIEKVNGTWVVYGLGNLLADQGTVAAGVNEGLMVEFVLRRRADGRVVAGRPEPIPTRIVRNGGPHVVVAP